MKILRKEIYLVPKMVSIFRRKRPQKRSIMLKYPQNAEKTTDVKFRKIFTQHTTMTSVVSKDIAKRAPPAPEATAGAFVVVSLFHDQECINYSTR